MSPSCDRTVEDALADLNAVKSAKAQRAHNIIHTAITSSTANFPIDFYSLLDKNLPVIL